MSKTPTPSSPQSANPHPAADHPADARTAAARAGARGPATTGPAAARPTIRIALPNGWARSGLAGIEAALIGWGLVMVLTLVGYLAVASNPWLGKSTWADATAVGGDLWGATLAAPVQVGDVTLRAVPTLMTVLVLLVLRALLLGGRGYPAAAQWTAVPTFALTSLALLGATAGHVSVAHAVPGALLVPALAALWAVVDQTQQAPEWTGKLSWLWEGLRQARVVLAVVALVGLVAVGVSLHANWEQVLGIHELLLAGTTDSVVLVIAQLLFAPTAAAWALSWLAGPGFWVGADTLHAPGTAPVAPIPAIPLLGAVPATAPGDHVALVLVGVGVLVGAFLRWRHRAQDVRAQLVSGAACAGGVALVLLAWFALSTLNLGEGRMSLLGPRVVWAAMLVTLEAAVTAQVLAVLAHPDTVTWVRTWTGARAGELRTATGARAEELRARVAEKRHAGAGADAVTHATSGAATGAATGAHADPDQTPTVALDIHQDAPAGPDLSQDGEALVAAGAHKAPGAGATPDAVAADTHRVDDAVSAPGRPGTVSPDGPDGPDGPDTATGTDADTGTGTATGTASETDPEETP